MTILDQPVVGGLDLFVVWRSGGGFPSILYKNQWFKPSIQGNLSLVYMIAFPPTTGMYNKDLMNVQPF